jgi:uncharacterized protein (DUF1015 family)
MAKVFPFQGIIYNQNKIKNLAKVMSPPYDIISPEDQEKLYNLHNFNVIRLILGKDFPGDTEYNNRYVRAAAFLDGWLRHEILIKAKKPSFYIYEQRFKLSEKPFTRLGFIGLLRLEDIGRSKVFPHEETYPKAKLDRLQLLRATNANLDAVFSLYSDPKGKISKILKPFTQRKPLIEVKDQKQVRHRLWEVERKSALSKIMKEMKDKAIFIADGHHRYEAALRYRNELKEKNTKFTEDEAYNHVMMYFTPLEEKGLVILPIHRVVKNLTYFDPVRFEQELSHFFEMLPYSAKPKSAEKVRKKLLRDQARAGKEGHAFGLYLGENRYFLLKLRSEATLEEMVAEEKPKAWKTLDVNILHYLVFDRILGISHETEDKIIYTHDPEEAIQLVDQGAAFAFFLNPTKIEEIVAIASKFEKLPHKSTFFYPKLLSGLVMYHFAAEEKIKI